MNLFIILAVTALCNGAKLDRTYLPPNAQTSGGTDSILQTPLSEQPLQNQISRKNPLNSFTNAGNQIEASGFGPIEQNVAFNGNQNSQYQELNNFDSKPERAQAAFERNAAILRQSNENDGERYSYAYETENGIYAEENGVATNGVEAEGGFSYTGDDGIVYSIRYTADQNGFVPQGEHLPTPPPVPEEILKALEQNARDEAAGIYDDGSYNEAKYANEESRSYDFNANNKYTNAKNQANNDAIIVNTAGLSGPSTNLVMPEFGRNSFVNNAPSKTYENAIGSKIVPSFVPNKPSFGNKTPFSSNSPVFGNNAPSVPNAPSFGANTPSVGSNVPAISAPAFGRSGQTPVYGLPTPDTAAPGFNRAVPSETSASFGQKTFAVSATSDRVDPEKAYLPPFQRSASQNGFGRTQSFSERNGYRY